MAVKELKVVRVLKALDDKGLGRLELFLDADFFTTDKSYLHYFNILRASLREDVETASSADLFNLVYPGTKFSYNKFARLNSQLLQLVYRFMSVEYLGQDPVRHWGMVIEQIGDMGALDLLDLTLPSLERALERAPDSLEKMRQELLLREVLLSIGGIDGRQARRVQPDWVIKALDEFYQLAQLRLECSILNRELVLGKAFEKASPRNADSADVKTDLVRLFELVKANMEHPDQEEIWLTLKDGLAAMIHDKNQDQFSREFLEVCDYTLNGCIRLNNHQHGRGIAREYLYQTYKLFLDHEILLKNDRLSPWHFKNIIQNLVITGRYREAYQRIESFEGRLEGDYQQNAIVYAKAYLEFHQGAFEDSLRSTNVLLQDFKDVYYGLDGRSLLLRCHFELGDPEQLEMQGEAFRQFLIRLGRRKALSASYLELYSDFLKNITALGKIVFGPPDKRSGKMKRFQERLEGMENLLHRDWLLSKIKGE